MKPLFIIIGALFASGCILTETVPEDLPAGPDQGDFSDSCEAMAYDHAVGCILACGADSSPSLEVEEVIRGFVGGGPTYAPSTDGAFDARRGTARWQTCGPNIFGGSNCEESQRTYRAQCTSSGVVIGHPDSYSTDQPLVPREVLEGSVLGAMVSGEFAGEPGSCLADCVAATTRPGCGGCSGDEACLATAFGDVCHPRGLLTTGARCGGNQSCQSLRCSPEEALCE